MSRSRLFACYYAPEKFGLAIYGGMYSDQPYPIFWIQADTPSGSGGCLQVTKSEHPPKTLSQAVNTPGNEPVCPEPSELDVSGGAGPQASVLRL